eukprot:TRINITY_DN123170_c0_g1_i1.p1 TRINITY_DN123170_c0_g1~~TRINITY_DN123170_c0_g1_i1.p1  ORF type:complete len:399 (-),score=60.93 TRINITY_DN123170_c0_g1_i1:229-1425(-)
MWQSDAALPPRRPSEVVPTPELVHHQWSPGVTAPLLPLLADDEGDPPSAPSRGPLSEATPESVLLVAEASIEELAIALSGRLARDRQSAQLHLQQVEAAERRLEEKTRRLEELQNRIFEYAENCSNEDIIELNVGGTAMSTQRAVLCSAEGSMLAAMFSGNFDNGHMRDKDGRVFLDVDPPLFAKVLSHLRLRRVASPDCPVPLPVVPEESRAEWEVMVRYYGLESYLYGEGISGNIAERLADLAGVPQSRLQSHDLIQISLSSSGGVPMQSHEEVLGVEGFKERSVENSYGDSPNTITIKFKKHLIKVEALELRAKAADIPTHMSERWTFRHGSPSTGISAQVSMSYSFTKKAPHTGRMEVSFTNFTDEVQWQFPKDFCIEHIVLHGRILPNGGGFF